LICLLLTLFVDVLFLYCFLKIINAHMMCSFIIINIKLDRFPLPMDVDL
jgi:hypothetical protein